MTLTAPTTTSNWSHALSLRERRGASGPPADAELAARRFARWQSQPPFTDPDLFGQNLIAFRVSSGKYGLIANH